ncbi:MAG: Cytochrome c oxidase copper chaperone [Caeruleum heppii]|nr:MAG: Cytochrome c oxidase copper chaperone [Caeruleum heppii]
MGSDLKPSGTASAKVKPCCVCKDEKAARDECMLFSDGDARESCKSTIDKYRSCMAGYGFTLPS